MIFFCMLFLLRRLFGAGSLLRFGMCAVVLFSGSFMAVYGQPTDYFPEQFSSNDFPEPFTEEFFPADSARGKRLKEVEISAQRIQSAANSVSPYQAIERKQLQLMQGTQASDAIRQFSGITLRDYGGIGGLKTVSIRSLGAGHTTVGYDGLPVSDGQTGQIDLGRFSLFSIEKITLNTGQSEN